MTALSRRAFLGAAAAAALPIAGCSGNRVPAGRVGVPFWFSYGGKNRQVLESLVAKFNASQDRTWILPTYQGEYFENITKVRSALAARTAPVITHLVGEVIPYFAHAGVLEDLGKYPGVKDLDLVPALAQGGTWLGGDKQPLVALPFNRSTPIMYLNKDMFDRAGLAPPATWNDLRAAAKALHRVEGGEVKTWGLVCPINWWFWVALVAQAGGTVVEADGTPTLGGEAGVKALELWQQMVHRDHTMRPPPGRDYNAWDIAKSDFLSERTAMIYTSTAFVRYLDDNARFHAMAAPLPREQRQAVPTGGTFFLMMKSASEEKKQAAAEFLRWMCEPQQTLEWSTATGYMPVSQRAVKKLEDDGWYREHPNDRVAMDQLKYAVPWPWAPNLFRVERECIDPLLEKAVLLAKDSRTVLEEARKLAMED